MNLQQLNQFAKDFQIDPQTLRFYGLHEAVILRFEGGVGLPNFDEWTEAWTEQEQDEFMEKYGVHLSLEFTEEWMFHT